MESMAKRQRSKGAAVVPLFGGVRDAFRLFQRAMELDRSRATWRDAERLYREVVRIAPGHWEAWNNLGVMAYQLGRRDEAMAAWERAIVENPEAAETMNNIGTLLQNEGKVEAATVQFVRALRIDEEMPEARVNLAMALQALGRCSAALRHWRYYLERWPEGENAVLARKHEALCAKATGR
jgi:tetratricopeptide (TPR) repeat protein